MTPFTCARHQFPAAVIQHAIWLYLRFTLSYRDVEELLAERGIDVSHETVRRWVVKFGPAIGGHLRRLRPRPSPRWHLDEMVIRVSGRLMYVWWAVDDEGEVLEVLIQRRRNKTAACEMMRKLLKKHGFAPAQVTTDKLRSYGAARRLQQLQPPAPLGLPPHLAHHSGAGNGRVAGRDRRSVNPSGLRASDALVQFT